jgi:hypothetical protein
MTVQKRPGPRFPGGLAVNANAKDSTVTQHYCGVAGREPAGRVVPVEPMPVVEAGAL